MKILTVVGGRWSAVVFTEESDSPAGDDSENENIDGGQRSVVGGRIYTGKNI